MIKDANHYFIKCGVYRRAAGGRDGFTLSEILVVVVLITIVTSSVYSLYEVGARAHRSAVVRAEAVSSMRFLQKLLSDKVARRSGEAYNAFMKKDGFRSLGRAGIESVMSSDISARSEPLYRAAGYGHYQLHESLAVENIGPGELKNRLPLLPASSGDAMTGPYFYEATREAEVNGSEAFRISFDRVPAGVFGSSFMGAGNSAVISTNASDATLEINTNAMNDLSPLIGPSPPANVSFTVVATSVQRVRASVFKMVFFFDSNSPPVETLSPNISPEDIRKSFVESASLFCADGMMFYERGTGETIVNHAIYLETPPEGTGPFAPDGTPIKTVRYAMAKKENGEWKYYDDALMSNALKFDLSYFDAKGAALETPSGDWKWMHAPKAAGVRAEIVTSSGGVGYPMQMTFMFDPQ